MRLYFIERESNNAHMPFLPGDIGTLFNHMTKFVEGPGLCISMGESARCRAFELFFSELIFSELLGFYQGLLK